MDFRFSEDEREIIDQAAKSLQTYLKISRFQSAEPVGDSWRSFGGEGWTHASLPEQLGGGDLPLVLLAAIGREAGRVLAGDAFVDNAVLLPRLLSGAANAAPESLAELLENP